MSKNGLRRHYDRLTGEERFRLDVLAMARGDLRESGRLVSSCPRATYTMTDRHFSGRWIRAMDLTLRLYVWVAEHLDRMEALRAVRAVLPLQDGYARDRMRDAYLEGHGAGDRQAWGAAEGEGPAPEWPLEGLEARVGACREALVLPDGSEVLYVPEEALGAVGAAIRGTEDALLARFLDAGTTEGLPGLCLALTGSRARG